MSILSWTDIFPDQLATDLIVEQRHAECGYKLRGEVLEGKIM